MNRLGIPERSKGVDDKMFGWINVARITKKISAEIVTKYDLIFSKRNRILLGSFSPFMLGVIKADWLEKVYGGYPAVISKYR